MPDAPSELAHDWYGLGSWIIFGCVAVMALWVWYDRKGFRARLNALEADMAEVKQALEDEKAGHARTQRILAVALRHLRDLWLWINTGRTSTPPPIPHELRDEI